MPLPARCFPSQVRTIALAVGRGQCGRFAEDLVSDIGEITVIFAVTCSYLFGPLVPIDAHLCPATRLVEFVKGALTAHKFI